MKIKNEETVIFVIVLMFFIGISLYPKPQESFTELYFINYSGKRQNISINEPFHVSFAIKNHENKKSDYAYSVFLEYYDSNLFVKAERIHQGRIFLDNNETVTISPEMVIKEPYGNQMKVSIKLFKDDIEGTYRSIQYWADISG